MSLLTPSIQSRREFESKLSQALTAANEQLAEIPDWAAVDAVRAQLESMQQSIAGGRTPSEDEREKINIGLIALREFDDVEPLASLCHDINHFFQDWPLGPGQ